MDRLRHDLAAPLPPWEAFAEELAAVLDEVGAERAALLAEVDAGPALPLIQAPTLVLHRRDAKLIPMEHGRYLADIRRTAQPTRILATFDGPGRAIRCAAALTTELDGIGIQIGAGSVPARLNSAMATSAASPSTSRPG